MASISTAEEEEPSTVSLSFFAPASVEIEHKDSFCNAEAEPSETMLLFIKINRSFLSPDRRSLVSFAFLTAASKVL